MGPGLPQQSSYAIGWGTLALINAGLAQAKNRSGLNWFLLSLLLGPVATFLLVLIRAHPQALINPPLYPPIRVAPRDPKRQQMGLGPRTAETVEEQGLV